MKFLPQGKLFSNTVITSIQHKINRLFMGALLFIALVLFSLFSPLAMAAAPIPGVSSNAPSAYFIDEEFCFDATFSNTGDTGFGPYLRLITRPDFNFVSSSLLTLSVEVIPVAGILPGLTDPISGTPVTGPADSTLTLLRLPIGSVVTGSIPLNVNICMRIDRNAVPDVVQNNAIQIQPAYEYGDTAIGANGPLIGSVENNAIMPEIIRFTEVWLAPESENPPGPQFTFPVNAIANIASDLTVTPVTFPTIDIDPERQFVGPIEITGGTGCTVTATSSTGQVQSGTAPFSPTHMTSPGGLVDITCNSATGTVGSDADVLVEFTVYIIDILNPQSCSTEDHPFFNTGKHVVIRKTASAESTIPTSTLTFSLNFAVSEFATADYIRIEDTLPDGYTYVNTTSMSVGGNAYSITPTVDHNNSTGQTKLTYDVSAVYAANFTPATTGSITYTATIDQSYESTGQMLMANDVLTNTVKIFYSILNGAGTAGNYCVENSQATVRIVPITTSKIIVNPKAEYVPGDEVTFRLQMAIPSGDTRNIVFEDYFPLPVFNVNSINITTNLAGNPDISLAPNDTLGLTPTNISIDTLQNKLTINWPDVNTTNPQTIVIDVKATISTEPFADNLFLTNLLGVSSENTMGSPTTLYAGINLHIRAPSLSINKQAQQAIVDANDTVQFDITLKNNGGATAYDVVINDTPQTGLNNCQFTASTLGGGVNGAGDYVIASIDAGVQAVVSLQCDVENDVESGTILINQASVTWTSTPTGTTFPPVTTTDSVDTQQPVVTKTIITSSEAHTADTLADLRPLTIGEIVRYQLRVTLPEGNFTSLRLTDVLPNGLVFENDGSAKLAFVSTTGTMTTDIVALTSCVTLNQVGDETSIDNIIPTCPITPTNSTFNSGTDPIFALSSTTGAVANSDDDNNSEYAIIELNARVLDIKANANGVVRRNKGGVQTLTLNSTSTNATSSRITLIEPLLAIKKISDKAMVDANDTLLYTINVDHVSTGTAAQQSTATAYDVQIIDLLPAGLSYVANSLAANCSAGLTPTLDDSDPSGSGFSLILAALPLGESCELSYQAIASTGLMSNDQIINTATLNWGSLPADGTTSNPTGTTPLAGNERSGSKSATVTVEVTDPIPVKSIVSTSQTHTPESGTDTLSDPRPVSIGESIRYRLVTQISEGTANNVVLNDLLPDGLQFITGSATLALVSNNAGINATISCNGGTLAASGNASTLATITPNCGISATAGSFSSGTDVAFNLGNLLNQDNDADKEFVIIEFDAQVLAIASNQQDTLLSNTFNIVIDGTTFSPSNAVVTKILEPQVTNAATILPAGTDTAHFTLTLENTGQATAFQVGGNDGALWQFALPAGLQSISNLNVTITGSVNENATTIAIQNSDFTVSGAENNLLTLQKLMEMQPASTLVIDFDAQKIPASVPANSLTTAVVEYASQVVGNAANEVRNGADLTTGSGNTPITSTAVAHDYRHELAVEIYQISGSVFEDNNVNASRDNATEAGIGDVGIVLYDGTSCQSLRTDAKGDYGFFPILQGNYTVYEATHAQVPMPLICPPTSQDPAAYRSSTANSLAVTISTANATNIDFGDVLPPTFKPDHSDSVLPNNVVFYTHTFTPKSTGTVTFNTTNSIPTTAGWSTVLYNDNNCDGLDSNDTPINTPLATTANTDICLINKVYAPSNVLASETYSNTINANFVFNGNAIAGSSVLTVTDITTASATGVASGASKLVLRKTVQNLDSIPLEAETETQNQAKPGHRLKYRIYYRNAGTGPISNLVINDMIPDFTQILGVPECLSALATSFSNCSHNLTDNAIEWTFVAGEKLEGGLKGMVSYEVTID